MWPSCVCSLQTRPRETSGRHLRPMPQVRQLRRIPVTTFVTTVPLSSPKHIARKAPCPNSVARGNNTGSICTSTEIVQLPVNWQKAVNRGKAVPTIGCGNPWHYEFSNE